MGGFSYTTLSTSQMQRQRKHLEEDEHGEVKRIFDMAQFSWYKNPALMLTKSISLPAAWVTCVDDKIQGAKQKELGKNTFFPHKSLSFAETLENFPLPPHFRTDQL